MPEVIPELQPAQPLLKELGISHIGTLVLLGQGPIQDSRTKIKLESLAAHLPGDVSGHEANTWMKLIARAAGELDQTGQVDMIIPSGRATGGEYRSKSGEILSPTEAEAMQSIIDTVSGQRAPQSKERFAQAQIIQEKEAKNTLYNVINTANMIDNMRAEDQSDPRLDNIWFMGSHFHVPRIKVLASLFGFDPSHVISSEEVLLASSRLKEKAAWKRGKLDPKGFIRQEVFRALIRTRLGHPVRRKYADYFQRKKSRAERFLDDLIDDRFKDESDENRQTHRKELKAKLYIEEQKDAVLRMQGERRWVRGLATQIDYVLPLAGTLVSDNRLRSFLLNFSSEELVTYGIDRNLIEQATEGNLTQTMKSVRAKIDPVRWRWQVVKGEWEKEEYPLEVKERFAELGITDTDVESLSNAQVPPLKENKKNYATIYIVRHGESDWNVAGRVQGQSQEASLTEVGIAQAKKISEQLGSIPIEAVFSSDLLRARQTAEIIALERKLEVMTDAALRERDFGRHQGIKADYLREFFEQWGKGDTFKQFQTAPVPRSESDSELASRELKFIRGLASAYPEKNVAVVAHDGGIRALLVRLGLDYDQIGHIENTAFIKLESDGVDFFIREIQGIPLVGFETHKVTF